MQQVTKEKIMKIFFGDLKLRSPYFFIRTYILKKHYPSRSKIKPMVIFLCNEVEARGGLCDRLRAMISVYKVCKKLGLKYKVGHFYPFDLSLYLKPNKVDWYIPEEYVDMNKHNVEIIGLPTLRNNITGLDGMGGFNLHMNYMTKYLKKASKKGKQIHVYTNAEYLHPKEYNEYFHELFKPSEDLQRLVDWNLQKLGGKFVSVTTRFQNLMGDFYEGERYKPLDSEEEKQEYIKKCIDKVNEIHGRHPNMKILVTSDSARFLEEVKKLQYVHVIPGKVVHLYFTTDSSYEVYLKSFVDLLTLSEAQKLYLIATGRMYISGFTRVASFINNRPCENIIF